MADFATVFLRMLESYKAYTGTCRGNIGKKEIIGNNSYSNMYRKLHILKEIATVQTLLYARKWRVTVWIGDRK